MKRSILHSVALLAAISRVATPQTPLNPWAGVGTQGTAVLQGFSFAGAGRLDTLRLHYTTLGTPRKSADGVVRNAVMVLHGTGGTGRGFLNTTYAGGLFAPGKPLDSATYFIAADDIPSPAIPAIPETESASIHKANPAIPSVFMNIGVATRLRSGSETYSAAAHRRFLIWTLNLVGMRLIIRL